MRSFGSHCFQQMLRRFSPILTLFCTLTLSSGCTGIYFHERPLPPEGPPPSAQTLAHLTAREGWYVIYFKGDEKIGFYHYTISPADEGNYRVQFESLQRFNILGIKKEVQVFEESIVTPEFRLVTTTSRQVQDGKEQTVTGALVGDILRVEVATEHQKTAKDIPIGGPLYPEAAIDFMPVLRGLLPGQEYRYLAFSPVTMSVGEARQRVMGYERSDLLRHDAYRVKTSFQNIEANSWFNHKGEKDLEILLDGVFIAERQTEAVVQQFIVEKTLAKSDLMLDYSRVKTDRPIPLPGSTRSLMVEILGMTDPRIIISDNEQRARVENNGTLYEIRRQEVNERDAPGMPMALGPDMAPHLLPSFQIQSRHPDIVHQAKEVVGDASNALAAVRRIAAWVGREVEDEMTDSFSAVDVLKSRKGECQAHTFLYTALARAQGIPTRVVSGLVYTEDVGFLFHAWAESYVGRWISVDPTFQQIPSDATHIKLVIGENPEDLHLVVGVIGRLRAVVKAFDHWERGNKTVSR